MQEIPEGALEPRGPDLASPECGGDAYRSQAAPKPPCVYQAFFFLFTNIHTRSFNGLVLERHIGRPTQVSSFPELNEKRGNR